MVDTSTQPTTQATVVVSSDEPLRVALNDSVIRVVELTPHSFWSGWNLPTCLGIVVSVTAAIIAWRAWKNGARSAAAGLLHHKRNFYKSSANSRSMSAVIARHRTRRFGSRTPLRPSVDGNAIMYLA